MKKIHVLIPALLFLCLHVQAGSGPQEGVTGVTITGGMFPHFTSQSSGKPIHNSRLKAKVFLKFLQNSFTPVDSTYYIYNGERGGETLKEEPNNDQNILFDESYTYIYNPLIGKYDNRLYRLQQFDADNKVWSLTYKNWRKSVGEWKDSARYSYLYANGTMVSSIYEISFGGFWSKHVESALSYDANNNVTEMNSTAYVAKFVYDNNNNLITMVDSQISPNGTWVLNERKNYSYLNNNVSVYTLEKWDPAIASWVNTSRWEYSYSGGNVAITTESFWDGSKWTNMSRHLYQYDGNNNKIEDIGQDWNVAANSFVNTKKQKWTYNIYNQPERIISETWNGSAWMYADNDEEIRFYYEYYFPTSINHLAAENNIIVYPYAAVNNININVNWDIPQSATIMIYDMKGSLAKQWQQERAADFKISIPVSDFGAGSYIVQVIGENSRLSSRFVVTH